MREGASLDDALRATLDYAPRTFSSTEALRDAIKEAGGGVEGLRSLLNDNGYVRIGDVNSNIRTYRLNEQGQKGRGGAAGIGRSRHPVSG